MPYCKKCGAELPEYAVFCTQCGLKYPVSAAPEEEYYTAPTQTEQTVTEDRLVVQNGAPTPQTGAPIAHGEKPASTGIQSEWFKNNSMALYIILGVVSIVLLEFCTKIAFASFGFGVVLGVFAILCAITYCTVGIIRYIMIGQTAGKKHTTCDNVCLALCIIGVIYVFVMTIVVLKSASDLNDIQNSLSAFLG